LVAIATRNLLHDKVRLTTSLIGVSFSVLLVTCLGGLFLSTSDHATGIMDHAGADLWITSKGTQAVDLAEPISRRRLYQVQATEGVLWAEPLIVQFSQWRLPDGRQEAAQIVGMVADSRLNLPWESAVGGREFLSTRDGVMIDERERKRFGSGGRLLAMGDRVEVLNQRVRIAGFSRGVGSITTIPYVFTNHKTAERCTPIGEDQTKFILVKAAAGPGAPGSVAGLQKRLAQRFPELDVLRAEQLAAMTRDYWLFGTGIGMGMVFAAVLGLIVGAVIVCQTLYSSTLERLREYATLKALGMGNSRVAVIVLQQAMCIGILGYLSGTMLSYAVAQKLPDWNLEVLFSPALHGMAFVLTMVICAIAGITSVARVFRLSPAIVFGG
jgi:putative ABC transport system permease protein